MNEQQFKTEYRRSENSVPVNSELKNRLIEAAKELEASGTQNIIAPRPVKRNRIRRTVIEFAAVAACAAICVCGIPELGKYFNEPQNPTQATAQPVSETETKKTDEAPFANGTHDTNEASTNYTVPEAGNASVYAKTETPPAPKATKAPTAKKEAEAKTQKTINAAAAPAKPKSDTVPSAGSDGAAQSEHAPAESPTAAEGNANGGVREINAATYPPTVTEKSNTTDNTASRSQLNERLDAMTKSRSKLDTWDAELGRYSGADEAFDGLYSDFKNSATAYLNAADSFERIYKNADESGVIYDGVNKYDNELDAVMFGRCRDSYRKAKNYAEMNISVQNAEKEEEATDE